MDKDDEQLFHRKNSGVSETCNAHFTPEECKLKLQ